MGDEIESLDSITELTGSTCPILNPSSTSSISTVVSSNPYSKRKRPPTPPAPLYHHRFTISNRLEQLSNFIVFYSGFANPNKQTVPPTFSDPVRPKRDKTIANYFKAIYPPRPLPKRLLKSCIITPFRTVRDCPRNTKMLFQSSFMRKPKPARCRVVYYQVRTKNTFFWSDNTGCNHPFCQVCALAYPCSVTRCPRAFQRAAFPEEYECCELHKLHCLFQCGATFCKECNTELDKCVTNCARLSYRLLIHLEEGYIPDFCCICPPGTHENGLLPLSDDIEEIVDDEPISKATTSAATTTTTNVAVVPGTSQADYNGAFYYENVQYTSSQCNGCNTNK